MGILEEGRKLAQRSLTFGIISVVLILLTFLLPTPSSDLLFWASWNLVCTRRGMSRRTGKGGHILSWIGVILPIALSVLAAIALLMLVFTLKG